MKKSTFNTIANIIAIALLILLIAGALAVCLNLLNGSEEDDTFSVTCNDVTYTAKSDDIAVISEETMTFEVKNGESYSAVVTFNPEWEFTFYAGQESCSYLDVGSLNKVFSLSMSSTSFTLSFANGYSLEEVLAQLYGEEIEISNTTEVTYPYLLTVTSEDQTIKIHLLPDVTGINIRSRIVF